MTKALPHNIEAERAVLGSIILNRDAITAVASWLEPADFYDQRHGWIYEAMLACYNSRTPPDLRTISASLQTMKRFDQVGGIGYLTELPDDVPSSHHIEHYARFVKKASRLRGLIVAGGKIANIGWNSTDDEAAITQAQLALDEATRSVADADLMPLSASIATLMQEMDEGIRPGTMTGLYDYDKMTGGLHKGRLVVVAARPSVGKSALALTLARGLARRGEPVLVFSLEMTRDECVDRLASMESGVDGEHIRDRNLDADELEKYIKALTVVNDWPIYIDETPGLSVEQIRTKTLRWIAMHGPVSAVIIDHMQLVTAPGFNDEYDVVTHVSKKLKELSKPADTTVIALSQLNRAVETRTSKEPGLSDLRASGAIEQDADQVVFIYRGELYGDDVEPGSAKLLIRKHRNGKTGDVPLFYHGSTTEFRSVATFKAMEGY